jgi:hypothetical protein
MDGGPKPAAAFGCLPALQGAQESNQILLFPKSKSDIEALIVKINHIAQ